MPITDEEVARREACYLRAKRELVPDKQYTPAQGAEVVGVKPGTLSGATYFGKLPTARKKVVANRSCGQQQTQRTIYGRDLIEYARQRWVSAVRAARSARTRKRAV